jgi:hypothetical protein
MRSEYYHPIERLPEKFDQLLEALSKVRERVFRVNIQNTTCDI